MLKKSLLLLCAFFALNSELSAQTNFYTVSPYTDSLWTVDSATAQRINAVVLTSSTGTVAGCNGLDIRPCTGDIYVVYKVAPSRYLGIVDPATGVITEVGDLGDNVAGICFGSANHLYAVTGDGATTPESLFKVDISTAAMTLFTTYGAGSDGETIEFCDDDGHIYHWSGRNTAHAMEKTDTATGVTTTLPNTGFTTDEVFGAIYVGNGLFRLANLDQEWMFVDTTGFGYTPVITGTFEYFKGICDPSGAASINDSISVSDTTAFCPGDSAVLTALQSGASYQWYDNGTLLTGETSQSYTAFTSGDYYVEIDLGGGCLIVTDTVDVTLLNAPVVGFSPAITDTTLCDGDSLLVIASSGGSSQWYMDGVAIAGADSNSLYLSMPGVYNMTKTNMNGCSDSSAVGITLSIANYPNVSLTPANDTSYCVGDSILLTGSSGGSSQWYMDGAIIPGATSNMYYVSMEGYFNMMKTNSNGCADSSAVGVNVIEDPCFDGLNEASDLNFALYPSPASDKIFIQLDGAIQSPVIVRITSIDGKQVYNGTLNNSGNSSQSINISEFSSGAYVISISNKGLSTSRQFFVE